MTVSNVSLNLKLPSPSNEIFSLDYTCKFPRERQSAENNGNIEVSLQKTLLRPLCQKSDFSQGLGTDLRFRLKTFAGFNCSCCVFKG